MRLPRGSFPDLVLSASAGLESFFFAIALNNDPTREQINARRPDASVALIRAL
jgi:hypothetical protein